MIAYLDEARAGDYLALCGLEPVLGARMHTMLRMYGAGPPADQWVATGADGTPAAALLRFDGWMVIIAGDGVDLPELVEFLRAVGGFRNIESSPALCRALLPHFPGAFACGATMQYTGGPFPGDYGDVVENPPLREVFDLLRAGSGWMAAHTHWETWYPHTSHLLRHGLGFAGILYRDGAPAATGGVYTAGPRHGVIGSLTTREAYRGNGLAAHLTRWLCNRLLEQGLTPVLLCASDALTGYYARLGFSGLGEWGEICL